MPQVSDSGEPNEHSHNALFHVAFPIVRQGQRSRTVISEPNTMPMHTPTNASPRHHWSSRHSSEPERIATPFSVKDLALKPHLLLHAGFNRRFPDVPPYAHNPVGVSLPVEAKRRSRTAGLPQGRSPSTSLRAFRSPQTRLPAPVRLSLLGRRAGLKRS